MTDDKSYVMRYVAARPLGVLYKTRWKILADTPPEPLPLLRKDGLLHLVPEVKYVRGSGNQTLGISLTVRAYTEGGGRRIVQTQTVKRSTPAKEQLRLLEAACNIVAVKEGCDYKLVHKLRSVQPLPENRYGL
jgi:hypothetical protein